MEMIREIREILTMSGDEERIKKYSQKLIENALYVLVAITVVMAIVNINAPDRMVLITTIIMCLGFVVCLVFLKRCQKPIWTVCLFTIIICALFTYYFFTGASEGISGLWLLVFPYAVMTVVDLKYGLYVSTYFVGLLILFCWTPAHQLLKYEYGHGFLIRFPLIYLFSMMIAVRTSYQLYKARDRQEHIIEELNIAVEAERKRNMDLAMQTIISISYAVDAKDPYTNEHSARVAEYSKLIAEKLGWTKEQQQNIYVAGRIHDIGKIGVPDAILNKPQKLTEEEFATIKDHPQKGYGIIKDYDAIEGIADGVLYHHERYDGKGYPKGLSGEEIPVYGRIIAVADAYDAMNSNRVYRKALDRDYIIEQLKNGEGTQFDPQFAEILLELIEEGKV